MRTRNNISGRRGLHRSVFTTLVTRAALRACAVIITAACLFTACDTQTAYHHYESVAPEGWARQDTLTFAIDTIIQRGNYDATLCIRTNATYPFRNLAVRTAINISPRDTTVSRQMEMTLRQVDEHKDRSSITYFTHHEPIATLALQPGDSITVKVTHNMRREVMQGITDVGIKLTLQ